VEQTDTQYTIFWKGARRGPFTIGELRQRARSGDISPLATVETDGQPPTSLDELLQKPHLPSSPPDPPESRVGDSPTPSPKPARETHAQQLEPERTAQRQYGAPPKIFPLILLGSSMALMSAVFLPVLCGLGALTVSATLLARRAFFPGLAIAALAVAMAGFGLWGGSLKPARGPSTALSPAAPMELPALRSVTKPAVVQVIALDDQQETLGTGSGFFIDAKHVVTNFHVVGGASEVVFLLDDETPSRCTALLVLDEDRDLAILRSEVEAPSHLILERGNVEEGERIAIIGSPLGLEGTLSDGIVSAVRNAPNGVEFVQMSAAISPGSSGSPVVNRFGRVVGVATMYHTGGQSLNFAVSAKELALILEKINQTQP